MAIGQVELNSAMTRIQEFTTLRHNEDQRGMVEQNHLQHQFSKQLDTHVRHVSKSEQSEYQNKKFDAKDKGSNQYSGDGGSHRKKKQNTDGRVLGLSETGFDVKI